MTLTLLDLYNTAASQEWAMYDNDAVSDDEFESSLVLALNKAIIEVYTAYDFPFRERTHVILTLPGKADYDLPSGIIITDSRKNYQVRYNSNLLKYDTDFCNQNAKGMPVSFCLKNSKIILNPVPSEKGLLTIDYLTLAIGTSVSDEEIYSLKNDTDRLDVPEYLEELMKNAVITKAILNSIASETDENYSAYKKQAEKALRTLVKYSKGVKPDKSVKI